MKFFKYFLIFIINLSCNVSGTELQPDKPGDALVPISISDSQSIVKNEFPVETIDTINKVQNIPTVSRHELVRFAKTLIGVPYKYASTDPADGFDCSGFITYVFNHFSLGSSKILS